MSWVFVNPHAFENWVPLRFQLRKEQKRPTEWDRLEELISITGQAITRLTLLKVIIKIF